MSLDTSLTNLLRKRKPGPPLVAFIGDSFMGGSSDVPVEVTIGRAAARALGALPIVSGQGGTGYLADGQANSNTFSPYGSDARLSSVAAARPDLVVFVGSINDDGRGRQAIKDAALKAFRDIRAKLPATPVVVVGAQPSGASRTVAQNVMDNIRGVRDAVAEAGPGFAFKDWTGASYSDNITPWSSGGSYAPGDVVTHLGAYFIRTGNGTGQPQEDGSGWYQLTACLTGTGYMSSPKGDGTRDLWLSGDATHPTNAGSDALGAALAEYVVAGLAEIVGRGDWTVPEKPKPLGMRSMRPADNGPSFPNRVKVPARKLFSTATVDSPVYVAHRCGYMAARDEFTTEGIKTAAAAGYQAVEISVRETHDSKFIGIHDWTTERTSSTRHEVWSTPLATLKATGQKGGDTYYTLEELLDVADRLGLVVLIDHKGTSSNASAGQGDQDSMARLIALLKKRYGSSLADHVVWKVFVNPSGLDQAADAGMLTATFLYDSEVDGADLSRFDILGLEHTATAEHWQTLTDTGKPTIAHIVTSTANRDTAKGLGATALMSSNPRDVFPPKPVAPSPTPQLSVIDQALAGTVFAAHAGYEYKGNSSRSGTSLHRLHDALDDGFNAFHLSFYRTGDTVPADGLYVPSASWQLRATDGTNYSIYNRSLTDIKALDIGAGEIPELAEILSEFPEVPLVVEYGPNSSSAAPNDSAQGQERDFWTRLNATARGRFVAFTWAEATVSRQIIHELAPSVKQVVGMNPSNIGTTDLTYADILTGNGNSFTAENWAALKAYGKPVWGQNLSTSTIASQVNERAGKLSGYLIYNKSTLGVVA